MKTLFGVAAAVAATMMSLAVIDSAEARGPRGGGNVSMGNIQVGPRATTPVIRPDRLGPQQFPRQIRGPRESGRGVNCYVYYVPERLHLGLRCPQRI
jgi:hypothetical protein